MNEARLLDAAISQAGAAPALLLDRINREVNIIAERLAEKHSSFKPETIRKAAFIGLNEVRSGLEQSMLESISAVPATPEVLQMGALQVIDKSKLLGAIERRLDLELMIASKQAAERVTQKMAEANQHMNDAPASVSGMIQGASSPAILGGTVAKNEPVPRLANAAEIRDALSNGKYPAKKMKR